ncbi:pyruvate dehydrogenase complex dihydrolipoamide acetyltransferase [Lutibaculum baratangense]|uniref:Acetyltransferase component of pyruvate dehydrogenase complex n=1 Tax=Lutibaculum baratangense AMV1 TaxID=631454 RepID=V4RBI5_9HYPH|nr:pyruvate dehydrogenase complex dihydrolipoamide acetyltransferase [Lutibaculum baratangense]ESR23506.1 Dihydrolipoamide acetyltransferase component of pyruvate dehydrogenase complex [Lutibaculum baratangense AMV1]
MPIDILMPALSPTMEKGNLAKWLVKEGDQISAGDVIAEIETDKATMEVEAVDEGTLGKILVPEGTADVAVNEVIAKLLAEGEDESALQGDGGGSKPAEGDVKTPKAEAEPKKAAQAEAASAEEGKSTAKAGEKAGSPQREGLHSGNGKSAGGGAPREATAKAGPVAKDGSGQRVFASPLARRIAKEKGVDLSGVEGSGPHGRILKRDVEAAKPGAAKPVEAAAGQKAAAAPAAGPMPAAPSMSDDQIKAMFPKGSFEEKPHDGMRRTIARRLTAVTQEVPVFYLTVDCRLDALLKLRKDLNDSAPVGEGDKPAYKLSVNDFMIKAMALALMAKPMANASWTGGARLMHKGADVGVAVAVPDGLFTPIIRDAQTKTLSVISNEMRDLAKRARDKKLKPEEYQGGVTAISNLGMYGIKHFTAIINPPHASILAIGASEQRPVVKDGAVAVETTMTATLACDHRVMDGALGAELLGAFKDYVEKPMSMLV